MGISTCSRSDINFTVYTMCQSRTHCFRSLMRAAGKQGLFYSIISKQTIVLLSVSRCCVAADARCQLTHKRKRTHYHHYFETYLEVPSSTCQSTLQLQTAPKTSHLSDISDWLICLGTGCSKAQRANSDWMSCLKLCLPQPAHNGCHSFIFFECALLSLAS